MDDNTPRKEPADGSGMGFLLGIILIIVLLVLFFVYGLPGENSQDGDVEVDIDIPLEEN